MKNRSGVSGHPSYERQIYKLFVTQEVRVKFWSCEALPCSIELKYGFIL